MLKFVLHCRWQLTLCVFLLAVWPSPCFAQSSSESPNQQASAADQQEPSAIAKELEALKKRVEQLEAELTNMKAQRRPSAGVADVPEPTQAAQAAAREAAAPAGNHPASVLWGSVALPAASLSVKPGETSAPSSAATSAPGSAPATTGTVSVLAATAPAASISPAAASAAPEKIDPSADLLAGTTLNFLLDGYYAYNFNAPIGRVNVLRAYDVSSNAFSLNQAAVVIERAADPEKGKRFGARLDLQYGQATETLQGNSANEPRPEIYRNIFQAYGTYVIPVGNGLTVDFGKWASTLGIEGNYTKDQMNYSRSFWFNFLPFYHMGVRANYKLNDWLTANYWVVNGTQQTEPLNGFKDQLLGLDIQPHKTVTWSVHYYLGQEHPDVVFYPNGGAPPNSPTEQGVPFQPIRPALNGRLHIIDSYMTWQASPRLTLALEGDYVIERLHTYSAPLHTDGGAAYARYQITPKFALAGRAEYLSDRGGLFTGATQALKETTFTMEYKFAEGLLMREEWRQDFSNQPFALTSTLGILKKEQNTATIGLVFWFGGKQGSW